MTFTDAEKQQRYREGKKLRGKKELRGIEIDLSKLDETIAKQKVKELIKNLEGMDK
jgi:hypothetical protein